MLSEAVVAGWRRVGLMVSAFVSRSSGPVSSPGRGHCVVFLDKTLYYLSACLHPGAQTRPGELNSGGSPAVDLHPIQGGVKILLVASCYKNRDKVRPDGSFGSYKNLLYLDLCYKILTVSK